MSVCDGRTDVTRPITVAELQAAVAALRRGEFAAPAQKHTVRDRTSPGLGTRVPVGERRKDAAAPVGGNAAHAGAAALLTGSPKATPVVAVLSAHAGAGASTVALAIAEAVTDVAVLLVDCGDPARSGLVAAAATELGVDADGWRRGRRGHVELARCEGHFTGTMPWQGTPITIEGPRRLVVLDVGNATMPDVAEDALETVTVGRATVPGVRRLEALLTEVGEQAVVAVVGPARWPAVVEATCGRRLQEARRAGRLVTVPLHRRLEVTGLTAEPLPRPVVAACRALWDLLDSGGDVPRTPSDEE